jgi:hypothetical protein
MKKSRVPNQRSSYGTTINEIYADCVFTEVDAFDPFTGFGLRSSHTMPPRAVADVPR